MSTPTGFEDTDLKAFLQRILRTWPLLIVSLIAFGALVAFLVVVITPPFYTASTQILIQTPMRYDDPNRMVQPNDLSANTDQNYYFNEKARITSQPVLAQVVKDLNLTTKYVREGIIRDSELYLTSPITVQVDSTTLPASADMPNEITFYVTRVDDRTFHLEGDGDYGIPSRTIEVDRNGSWGEWFMLDDLRLRVLLNLGAKTMEDDAEVTFGFQFLAPEGLYLDLIDDIESDFVEAEATMVLLSYTAAPGTKALDILDAMGSTYVETHMVERREMLDLTIKNVENEINHNLALINANSASVEAFRTQEGVTDLDQSTALKMKRSETLDSQREDLQVKNKYYSYLQGLLANPKMTERPISPKAFGIDDPILDDMTKKLAATQSDIITLQDGKKTAHPYYAQLVRDLQQQRENILNSVEGFKASNEMLLANVNSQRERLTAEQRAIPATDRQLTDRQRDIRALETQHNDLLARSANLRISRASMEPEVKVTTPAYLTSDKPLFPDLFILPIVAFLLAMMVPFFYLVIQALFSDRISSVKSLARSMPNSPVVGQVPFTSLTDPSKLIDQPQADAYTKMSQVAAYLELIKADNPAFSTLVSPAYDKESGHAFTKMLAAVLADRGGRTLIVNAIPKAKGAAALPTGKMPVVKGVDELHIPGPMVEFDPSLSEGYDFTLILGPKASALPAWKPARSIKHALIVCELGETPYHVLDALVLAQINGQLPEIALVLNKIMDHRLPYFGLFRSAGEKGLGLWGALKYNWQRAL